MEKNIKDKKDITSLGKCKLCFKEKPLTLATIKCLSLEGWFEEDLMMCNYCIVNEKAIKKDVKTA